MNRKLVSKSAFFSPRFLTGFAFCSIGLFLALLVFARPNKPVEQQNKSIVQQSIPTFVGVALPAPKHGTRADRLDQAHGGRRRYRPGCARYSSSGRAAPASRVIFWGRVAVRKARRWVPGKAFMGITHEVVNARYGLTPLGTLSSGWTPARERAGTISMASLRERFAANARRHRCRRVKHGLPGFGYFTIDQIGLTSGKDDRRSRPGRFDGPVSAGRNRARLTPSTPPSRVAFYLIWLWLSAQHHHNGDPLSQWGLSRIRSDKRSWKLCFVLVTPANSGDTSAVYSADTGIAGSMAGVSLEERADAGTPPVGDQNAARVFFDRATLNSAIGGIVAMVGEGFEPGETVTISGCVDASVAGQRRRRCRSLSLPTLRPLESRSVSSQAGPADAWRAVITFCTRTSQTFAALSPRPRS